MKAGTFARFFLGLVLVVVAGAAWFLLRAGRCPENVRYVLLISIDTCRADYLSCYGYPGKTTPNIDAVAGEGILFENVISPVPITLPAHSSMLTGTIPPYHGVHDNYDYRLGSSNVTLAETLHEHDYQTAAIIGAFVMDSEFGLDQGFDTYNDRFDEETEAASISERRGGEVSRYALQWLEEHHNEPFFLFLHYFDPHVFYDPPEPFKSKCKMNDPSSFYAGEISYTDYCIGQVIAKLKQLGLYDSTLIIITSDHGEMLGEHGEFNHSYFIYQSAIKVPLIFKLPGQHKSRKVKELIGIIDIVPTVCSLLGIELPSQVQGQDLSCYFLRRKTSDKGGPHPAKSPQNGNQRYVYCESFGPTIYKANSLLGVVTEQWKYIQTTRPELYDLVKDPDEIHNLVKQQPEQGQVLQGHLKQILEESVNMVKSESNLELDEQSRQRLESLGYVSSGIEEGFEFDRSKDDPKDLIGFHSDNAYVFELIAQKRYAEAEALCQKMLIEKPDYEGSYRHLSRIAEEKKDKEKAVFYLSEALKVNPNQVEVRNSFAAMLAKEDRTQEAIEHFTESLRIKPDQFGAYHGLGNVFVQQRKLDQAVGHYRRALQFKPDSVITHKNLAKALQLQGKMDEAISHFRQVLVLSPDHPEGHHDLGNVLISQGNVDEAISYFRQALKLKPDYDSAHHKLGSALMSQGNVDEALKHFSKTVELEPDSASAHYVLARALNEGGKTSQATKHFRETLRLKPDWVAPMNSLAWLLATHNQDKFRNPEQAVQLAERACELTSYARAGLVDTLAAAYASAGRFADAVAAAEKTVKLAGSAGEGQLHRMQNRLKLYKSGKPYREPPPP